MKIFTDLVKNDGGRVFATDGYDLLKIVSSKKGRSITIVRCIKQGICT